MRPPRQLVVDARRIRPVRAFTLLEVLIVLSLLVLLAAMAWPLVQSQIVASELPESANRAREMLYMTRSAAMLEHRRHRVRFEPGQHQPVIEVELDPIFFPGEWTHCTYPWASEPVLLENVYVHGIYPGRPDHLKPVSATESTDGRTRRIEERRELSMEIGVTAGQQIGSIGVGIENDTAELDPKRPPIVFETDGSTGWATFVLAKLHPDELIDEQTPQLWILLDGRTGLARVQEQITEEQLANPDFYVQREKLEMPELVSTRDLTLNIGTEGMGSPVDPGMQPPLGGPGMGGGFGGPEAAPMQPMPVQNEGFDDFQQLEDQLQNSEFTEEERDQIRRNFQGGGRRR